MNTYDINKIKLPNGDICNLRDSNLDNFIQISDLQPTDDGTKIWISTNEAEEYEVPTYDEFLELKDQAMLTRAIDETNLIHIEDAAKKPLKECKIDIQPVQDLHGYDKPWTGGSGKNLLPMIGNTATWANNANGTYTATDEQLTIVMTDDISSGVYTKGGSDIRNVIASLNGVYTWSIDLKAAKSVTIVTGVEALSTITTSVGTDWQRFSGTGTFTGVNRPFVIYNNGGSGTATTVYARNIMIESGSSTTAYEPYSNICPITGWDSVEITRTRKNMLNDNDFENGYISENGELVADASYKRTKYIVVDHDKSYTFSLYHNGTAQAKRVHGYDANKNWVSQIGIIVTGTTSAPTKKSISFTVAENIKYIRIGSIVPALDTNIQLELGFTATDYESYQGQTYNITFPSEAGTVYGGTLNVLTGELTVDRGITTLADKTFGNKQNSILSAGGYIIISGFSDWISANKAVISDMLQGTVFVDRGADGTIAQVNSSQSAVNSLALFTTKTREEAIAIYKDATICYPLATPVTYQLTPQEITTLLGINNIWADTGNISCTYYINSKLNTELNNYVQKTDYANNNTCGVVKTNGAFGILTDNTGLLKLVQPTDTEIQTATGMYKVITPYSQHKAAFYGLARAAGDTTQASSTNTVGNYTQDAKTSIQDMLGISDIIAPVQKTAIASQTYLINEKFYYKGKLYKANSTISADGAITPGVNCSQITLTEAMPVSIVEGQGTNSLVLNGFTKSHATGEKSLAEGTALAKASCSHAEGWASEASGSSSHAEGYFSKAEGSHSHAEGGFDNTRGKIKITGAANATTYTYTVIDNDFEAGFYNLALQYNNSLYYISTVDTDKKTVTVTKTLSTSTALSDVQVQWGSYPYAQSTNAHAENSAYAYGQGSHAEGVSVSAELYSHAEGKSYTIGEYSHAENNSIAAGNYSHAQGYGSTLGAYAHAQGYNTSAEGANSHVEGQHTTASRKNQHVFGKYNIKDEPANTTGDDLGTYVEIVGNGTSTSATSNARTLDWNGNEVLAGSLTIGGNEVLNKTTLQQLKKMPVNIVDGNGTNSIVLGNTSKAKATGTRAIAEATGTATGNNSHAEGWSTEAKATAAHSEGYFSKAVGSYSHAEGGYYATFGTIHVTGAANATTYTYAETFAYIEDDPNYLIIYNNTIYTVSSVDVTNQTITLTTTLNKSAAVSNLAVDLATTPYAYGNRSHAEGSAYAQGQLSHAQGNGTRATAFGSHAEGKLTTASGQYSHAEGVYTLTSGQNAHAEGMYTSATSDYAHVEGMRSQATNTGAHAEGYLTKASGYYSHAQGYNTSAKGTNSHAEGYSVSASGQYSHAEGFSTQASGDSSHAEGYSTQASGTYSHVEGLKARASGVAAHAEGNAYSDSIITLKLTQTATSTIYQYSQPTNPYCLTLLDNNNIHNCMLWVHLSNGIKIPHKITNINTANNTITLPYTISGASTTTDSIVADIGYYPNAEGNQSHAEGSSSAQGGNSHAEGYGTLAAQFASHAEGYIAQATGVNSHAEGEIAEASGKNAHAQGQYTIANHKDQHVFGRYNIADPNVASATEFGTYVEIVGNGNDVTRSNARTLDWNGNEVLAGSITLQNGTSNTITLNKAYFNQFPTNIINGTGTGAVIQGKIVPDEYIDDVGIANIASGLYSHAEGEDTTASAWNAHAQGYMSKATQQHTHAEGISTKATGSAAHTEGNRTQASGAFAHAQGQGTIANHRDQHASGRYNIADSNAAANTTFGTYVEIVGNGTDANTRSNARTLDWNGNETLAGNLTLGDHTLMPQAVPSVIFGTQTGTTAAWTGVAPFSTLIDGTVILYWLPQTSASNATLNLTLANGLTTGAKNIYIDGTTRCGTQIASGNLILMMYRYKPTIGSATDLQGWWIVKS